MREKCNKYIEEFLRGYTSMISERGSYIFEHYIVFEEDEVRTVNKYYINSYERANALAYNKGGVLYKVWQCQNGHVYYAKMRVHKDNNVIKG